MRVFREPEQPDWGKDAVTFTLGALGGLAVGMLLSRRPVPRQAGRLGTDLRERARAAGERARTVARRLRPARLRRMAGEQLELTRLEDNVLDALLADSVLSERGIDVGAISPGIIELSGSVWTEEEADHAVRVANALPGVRTVVNRMEIDSEARNLARTRSRFEGGDAALRETRWTGRMVGMNRRRQGRETDPDRPDDSQHQVEEALEETDVQQWMEEGFASPNPRKSSNPESQAAGRTRYDEDELDHQDPHGKHARVTLDDDPQDFNTAARVGEGLKPGTHLRLESSDVPVKPGAKPPRTEGEDKSGEPG